MSPRDLARVLRAVADAATAACEQIEAESRAECSGWSDQTSSPLGRRRHVAAVRRRLAAGTEGAAMVGRRALLSPPALADELASLSARPRKAATLVAGPDALRAKLGLVAGGRS